MLLPHGVDPAHLHIKQLEDPCDPRWDCYVRSHPEGTFFHQTGWLRIIRRAFGHPPHYLFAMRKDRVVGVFPLFEVGAFPFSKALVSIPIGVSGGILADDMDAATLLRQAASTVAKRVEAGYVEYKSTRAQFPDLPTRRDLYVGFTQELFDDRERQLKAIPRKTRAMIREAEAAKLRYTFNREDLEPFYDLYALSLRNLGTPMFPKELFVASLEELGDACDILTVRQTGRIIGAVMNYYYKDQILPFYAGTLPEARDVNVNNFAYWGLLQTGYERGYRLFDFGRSRMGTGSFNFKKRWGMKQTPLEYQYDLVSAPEMPSANPSNPKYARVIGAWKRLPVEVTKVIGPIVSKRVP